MSEVKKLVAFDMDGTLLDGRFIYSLGSKFGFLEQIKEIQKNTNLNGKQRTEEIAKLLKGMPLIELTNTIESMELVRNLQNAIEEIKKHGHIVGIISDSYLPVVNHLVDRFGLDFAVANDVEVDSDDILTGVIRMPLGWNEIGCYCQNSVCKRFHLEVTARQFGIPVENTVAVGDTYSDSCMVERAGIGIALTPKDKELESRSDIIITEADASKVLPHILN